MTTRKRGITVTPIASTDPYDLSEALAVGPDGARYVICTEGVGREVDPAEYASLEASGTREPVDLADWVRTFGDRLERNYGLWYRRLSGAR